MRGRQLRCPACDAVVEVTSPQVAVAASGSDNRGTVAISPAEENVSRTVMLEPVHVVTREVPAPALREPAPPPTPPKPRGAPQLAEQEPDTGIKTRHRLVDTEMDMTPMVDVTFLLLIFFMVTAAFSVQKSIEVPKPQTDQASSNVREQEQNESERVTVRVDESNTYRVTTVDWEEEAPSVQELLRFLRQARDGDSTGNVPTTLLVEASGEALHEKVVAALDAGSQEGFSEVLLATVEEE